MRRPSTTRPAEENTMSIKATIIRRADRLWIGWDAGSWQDRSGDYPATQEGLADIKADLKADSMASADDFAAIDAMDLPDDCGGLVYGESVDLSGEGDES
jgi:hypothetical protein